MKLHPSDAEQKAARGLASRWFRKAQAGRIKAHRRGMPLRTQIILLLGILVVLATASLGSIAYRTSRTIIEQAAIREVGVTATVRKQVLIRVLTQQRERADALLKTAEIGCLHSETWCLSKLLLDFAATEGATAARLDYRGRRPVMVGKDAASLLAAARKSDAGRIAYFEIDRKGQPSYVLQSLSRDGRAVLTIRGDMQLTNQIFLDRYGLGQSGETYLTDEEGSFLTPPKYPVPGGQNRPQAGKPMQMCLAGMDGEVLGLGYRGVAVIRGFRSVPEIGGGCIMALIDQAEAFAPTKRVAKEVAQVSGLLAVLAIGYSLLLAQLVSRPLKRLTGRARSLQRGDFDSPVPVEGPAEVRMFAQTFQAMAHSLKNSQNALEASSEQTRNILESISDGFAAFDRQWRCTYVNDKATELSRITRTEILGKNVWKLYPGIDSTIYAELCRAMEQGVSVHLEEHYAPFDIWFEIDAYPTRDGLAVFGRDITERKRFNDRLQQTQKLESLGVLAGGIAHDFNNLLTGIMGNASIVLDDLRSDSPVRENLEAVLKASERAALLTRQLLAYAGKARFVVEQLNLSDLVGEITNLLHSSIPRTVELQVDLRDHLPSIEGDAAQIQQLIMNLVINAAEAVEEGKTETVLIVTRLEQVTQSEINQMIAPNGALPGQYVTLEVRDSGCGMDGATLSRIFEPFFTTKFTGRGLGLAAVLGMVRGHKGALQVESAPGKGSRFKVLFPIGGGVPATVDRSVPQKSLTGNETVLVIDDEDMVRQTAKSALESYGYRVIVASNGKEGVRVFQERSREVAAVLLDMTMPVMSGEEALVRLKSIRPDIRVVLSSGYNEADATRRFTGKGLAGFVQKPYTAACLAETMKIALESSPRPVL